MHRLLLDLRYGARMLLKKPGISLIAVATLALGIGANSAIFSVINTVLLGELPFKDTDRLVVVWDRLISRGVDEVELSPVDYEEFARRGTVIEQMAATERASLNLTGNGEPLRLEARRATASLFPLLGVAPMLGRTFTPEEDRADARVAVLGYALWQRRFAGDRSIVGRDITVDSRPYTVIGVMPPAFEYPSPGANQPPGEIWFPRALETQKEGRDSHNLLVVAKLKPGVGFAQVQADFANIALQRQREARGNNDLGVAVVPLQAQMGRKLRTSLLVLASAVGFVLLIACANVANLLLAMAASRRKEIAVRLALGADRARIVRQMLTESLLLAMLGGGAGLLLAVWMCEWIRRAGAFEIPRAERLVVDGRVLLFTFGAAVLTGFIFGSMPALQASRADLNDVLKDGGRGAAGTGRGGWRDGLVVAEIALSLMLLVGAGLLLRSFWRLQQVDPGFNTQQLLSVDLAAPETRYPENALPGLFGRMLERMQTLPGVTGVALVNNPPLSGRRGVDVYRIEGRPAPASMADAILADFRIISPNYFQVMGIPLLQGRAFTENDGREAMSVAIVNQAFADRYMAGENPLGHRLQASFKDQWLTVVGVAGNVRQSGLQGEAAPHVYVSYKQISSPRTGVVVRTASEPLGVVGGLRGRIQEIDPDQPIYNIHTMEELLDASVAQRRLNLWLLSLFAGVALLLTLVGLYGVISYSVSQRTREIGLRMALGAQRRDMLALVLGRGMKLALVGIGIGLLGALALTRLMTSMLFGVAATDPPTFAAIALLLAAVAGLACWLPARRAASVDPMEALKYE